MLPFSACPIEQLLVTLATRFPVRSLQIEGPDGLAKYERLLFSNIDDATGTMLDTIVRKVREGSKTRWPLPMRAHALRAGGCHAD